MSGSELSDAPTRDAPSDKVLERALRKETARQSGEEDFTVNTIRKGAEEALALDVGFFLNDKTWKARSKTIIKDEMVSYCYMCFCVALLTRSGRTS